MDDAAFGSEYAQTVGLEGIGSPLDWANRRIELPDGGWAVTGIRFRGRDVRRPFIDVLATTASATRDGLSLIAQALVPAYERCR